LYSERILIGTISVCLSIKLKDANTITNNSAIFSLRRLRKKQDVSLGLVCKAFTHYSSHLELWNFVDVGVDISYQRL
jgi:hypothetical protein